MKTPTLSDRLSLDGDQLQFLLEAGYALLETNSLAEFSPPVFEAVELLAPNAPSGGLGLAQACLVLGDHARAERAAARASRTAKVDREAIASAHLFRAAALAELGRVGQARTLLQRALVLEPEPATSGACLELLGSLDRIPPG